MARHATGEASGLKGVVLRGLALVFAFTVAACLGIVLVRLDILRPLGGLVLSFFSFAVFVLLQRQGSLRKDVALLRSGALSLDAYETDIDRRIEKLALQIEKLEDVVVRNPREEARTDAGQQEAARRIDRLERSVIGLTKRMADLQTAAPVTGDAPDMPVAPLTRGVTAPSPAAPQSDSGTEQKREQGDETGGTDGAVAMQETAALDEDERSTAVRSLMAGDALQLVLQPIVALPERQPAHFQASMRLRRDDGGHYPDAVFRELLGAGQLGAMVERKVVFACVRMLRVLDAQKRDAGLFCTISSKLLADGRGFNELAGFLEAHKAYNTRLTFVLTQRSHGSLKVRERERLGRLADLGFPLALGDLQNPIIDASALVAKGFRFVTVQSDLLLRGELEGEGADGSDFVQRLTRAGLETVAFDVEREDDVVPLIDCDVRLARGLLFAPPRPVRADLLDGTGRAAA